MAARTPTLAGTEFVNKEVERVAQENGFKIRKSRPFSPSTNGKAEHKVTGTRHLSYPRALYPRVLFM